MTDGLRKDTADWRERLLPLLDHLAVAPADRGDWAGWRLARVAGGANNLVYRATGEAADLAIKFTIRDERDRAGREFTALSVLWDAGLRLAPRPLLLERERYAQPVVVQSWLAGEVAADPPAGEADWRSLLGHYAALHRLTPSLAALPLRPATLPMTSAMEATRHIGAQAARIPARQQSAAVREALGLVAVAEWPSWPAPDLALCRCDPTPTNFVRRPAAWASVDWENAGWGDPAFELADLMAHPTYAEIPAERWEWVIAQYVELHGGDAGMDGRIRAYAPLMLAWWVARLARYLYEIPRGLDPRLVERRAGWQENTLAMQRRYLERTRVAIRAEGAVR